MYWNYPDQPYSDTPPPTSVSVLCLGLFSNNYDNIIFRLDKRQDRNIETTLEVCDANGNVVEGCLSGGVRSSGQTSTKYHIVVYYHDGKPKWNEVV